MMGDVTPEIMSKLYPSKVISWGISFAVNKAIKQISTGNLTICKSVRDFISNESIKDCPLLVTNKKNITANGGTISKGKRGGTLIIW